jgi:hypothetical protein
MADYGEVVRDYVGVIWIGDAPGKRFSILATSLDAAQQELEAIYGVGHIFTLHNENDANKPR